MPVIGPRKVFSSDRLEIEPKLQGGERVEDSLESLKLPSQRMLARRDPNLTSTLISDLGRMTGTGSKNEDQTITETLFLAGTLTPPRLDEKFLNNFKSHHEQPDSYSLRLVRVSWMMNDNQTVDRYIVICNSQKLRSILRDRFIYQPSSDDESLKELEAFCGGNSPISLVRCFKQHVIDQLCHNLDCLKIYLEETVSNPIFSEKPKVEELTIWCRNITAARIRLTRNSITYSTFVITLR